MTHGTQLKMVENENGTFYYNSDANLYYRQIATTFNTNIDQFAPILADEVIDFDDANEPVAHDSENWAYRSWLRRISEEEFDKIQNELEA